MVLFFPASRSCLTSGGKRKIKCSPFVQLCLGPDAATMPIDDALNCRETDSTSLEFICGVQSLESSEELLSVTHIKPNSVVAHKINIFPNSGLAAAFDYRERLVSSKFDRVCEQILKYLSNEALVAIGLPQ